MKNEPQQNDNYREPGKYLVSEKTEGVTVDPDEINDHSAGEEGQGYGDDYQGRSNKERQED